MEVPNNLNHLDFCGWKRPIQEKVLTPWNKIVENRQRPFIHKFMDFFPYMWGLSYYLLSNNIDKKKTSVIFSLYLYLSIHIFLSLGWAVGTHVQQAFRGQIWLQQRRSFKVFSSRRDELQKRSGLSQLPPCIRSRAGFLLIFSFLVFIFWVAPRRPKSESVTNLPIYRPTDEQSR